MTGFPDIDEVQNMLEQIIDEIPKDFFKSLNEGVVLLPQIKMHPASKGDDLLVLGEYASGLTGRNIKIYYGSFNRVYGNISKEDLYEKLKDTLLHEFTHHLESLSGERGLEIKDAVELNEYKESWLYD